MKPKEFESQECFPLSCLWHLPTAPRVAWSASRLSVVMHTASTDAGEAGRGQAVNQRTVLLASVNSTLGVCEWLSAGGNRGPVLMSPFGRMQSTCLQVVPLGAILTSNHFPLRPRAAFLPWAHSKS